MFHAAKSYHASPNDYRPTPMFHNLMDMLRPSAYSITNPTPWPTIWVEHIYFCLATKKHAFTIINGPILIHLSKPQTCENMFTAHKWFPLLHLCTQSSLSQSTPHSDVKQQFTCFILKLFCCHGCSSKSTFHNKSDTTPLLSGCK